MKRDIICAQRAAYRTVFLVSLAVVIALGSCQSIAKADVFSNVPEASGFGVVYVLPIPNLPDFDATIPYSVNNSAGIADGSFSRVAYYLELEDTDTGYSEWVYASFDAANYATEADMLGIPTPANDIVYQYNPSGATGQVENMNVFSNDTGITTGYGITTGNAEMWPNNYGQANGAGVSGASGSTYDFGDTRNTSGDHGSFQLHNYGARQTLFAINHFNRGQEAEMGIGTQASGQPDWTSNETSADYEIKNLVILAGNPLSWNGGGGTTGPLDGSGTWDASSTNWWDSASAAWTDGSNAVFGAGTGNGTAGTVTISGTVKPASIAFSTTGDGNAYTLTGGTIDLNGSVMSIRANVNATINSPLTNGGIETLGAGNLSLGGTNTLSGTTTVSAGTLTLASTSNNTLGTVNVKGGAAGAQLVIEGTTDLGSNNMNVATAAADRSTVVISGNAAMNRLYVGSYGAGAVIQNGGSVSVAPGTGSTDVTSLGLNGGYGYYQMNGGTLTTGQLAVGGGAGGNNVGVFDMNGGTVNVNGGATNGWLLAAGWNSGSKGSINVFDGTLIGPRANPVSLSIFNDRGAYGMLNMLGDNAELDATANGNGVNVNGGTNNVQAIVNLSAGTIVASRVYQGAAGNAQFNFNGGTLQAKEDSSVTFSLNTGGSAYIYGGDAKFDGGAYIDTPTSATTLTINAPLLAPTGYGVTEVAITDAGAGYIGAPFVVLSGGSGVGASAIAQVDLDPTSPTYGQLTNILVTSAGSGYAAGDVLTATLYGRGATTAATLGAVTLGANTSGGLTKLGAGTLVLSQANTYTGATTINAGTLAITNGNALSATSQVTVNSGATLEVRDVSMAGTTLVNVQGGGNVVLNCDTTQSSAVQITGAGGLRKAGTGMYSLTGSNSYSGTTYVTGGTLEFAASSDNSLGTVNVNGGAAGAQLVIEGTTDLGSNNMNVATAAADRSTVVISGNAAMNRLYVGDYGAGAVIQDGGTVTIGKTLGGQNVLSLGFNGGYGYYQMNGGSLTTGQLAAGSGSGSNDIGVFDMNGGTVDVTGGGGWLLAGGWATNAKGSFNLWGGTMTGPASNAVTLNVFTGSSTGMLNMLGSTAVLDATKNSGGLNVMREANVSSIVNLNAGTIIASRVQQSGAGSAQFNFNGGTLQAKADTSVTFSLNTGGSAYIYGGDANFDGGAYIDTPTSATTLTITTPLLAPTGYGATSVVIADAGAGYVGAPFVVLSGGSGVGASAIAQVDLDSSSPTYGQLTNILITSAGSGYAAGDVLTATLYGGGATTAATLGSVTLGANTSGGLTVRGSGTVTLAGANTYSGDTTIRAGTLKVANADAIPSGAGKGNVAVDGALDVAGYTANVNGLSGVGTINNSTGNGTLVVGNNNADGLFSGVIRNTSGTLALAKVGTGTLTLTGNNSYSGGTTVSQGTLAVGSPTPTTVNPLGTGPVTLGGGTLRLSGQAAMFNTAEHPVTVTGWDKDFVWANSELTADGGTDPILNNWVYYEAGPTHNGDVNGLPTSRSFTSLADSAVTFEIEPYDGPNSVWLSSTPATLTLDNAGHYTSLHLLNASGNGAPTVTYTLTFADSSTTTGTFVPRDWTSYNAILTSLAQRSTSGGTYYNNAGLSQTDIVLSSADQAKVLSSISFTAAGGGGSWVMAVSGTSGTLGYASTQTYGNAVNVTADSTIDVRNSLAARLGSLSIGNHTLSLTGDSGASLTVGTATLSGNATFNTAADTTLNVGAIGDGSAGHGITKMGAGTMTLGGHSSYGGNTIISEGTLRLSGTTSALGNIMPLGDSITYGSGGTNAGYRGPLYALLDDEGYTFQYVGSWNNNSGSLPTTPVNQTYHEGHGGWRTGDESIGILHGVKTVADGGLGWLAIDPDVILLHIGTNNTPYSEPQSITDVGDTLDQIYQQRPTATTFVAQIIPKATALTWVDQYNADLAALVGTKQAAGYNVVLVDMNTDYPIPWSTTLPDNVHPNDTGYEWMAEQWYDAIATYLGIASENGLPGTTAVSLAAGATLDLNGVNQTIASLADYNGGGGQVVNGATDTPLTLTINPDSGSTTFSGTISDSGAAGAISLVKSGAGTQILAGANTYHGGTEVNEGTLLVNNTTGSGTGSGNVVVNGGTLGGSGTIAGVVTVTSGTIAPGNSPGILTLESGLTMTGGTLAIELDGLVEGTEYDQLLVTDGTVNLGEGVASLALSLGFTPEIDDLFWIINNTGEDETTGYFQGLEEGSRVEMDGGIFRIRYGADYASGLFAGGNDVLLQAIPEPATLLMLLTLGLLPCRRRRR